MPIRKKTVTKEKMANGSKSKSKEVTRGGVTKTKYKGKGVYGSRKAKSKEIGKTTTILKSKDTTNRRQARNAENSASGELWKELGVYKAGAKQKKKSYYSKGTGWSETTKSRDSKGSPMKKANKGYVNTTQKAVKKAAKRSIRKSR